jgi:hypothetical protein
MGQILVASLVLTPAPINLSAERHELALRWLTSGITCWETGLPGFEGGNVGLQEINLSPGPGLLSLKGSSV